MKTALLLLTSSLVIAASGAFAQGNTDACHNQYGSCMERCSTRPQSVQESCSNTCEANTNQCYSGMYGQQVSARRPSRRRPNRLRLRSPRRATKPKPMPRPRPSRKREEITPAQATRSRRGVGRCFSPSGWAAHAGDDPSQRCCLLAEDAGAERMFPQGSFDDFLSGIFSLTVRLYCASISRSRWASSGVKRRRLSGIMCHGHPSPPVLPLAAAELGSRRLRSAG